MKFYLINETKIIFSFASLPNKLERLSGYFWISNNIDNTTTNITDPNRLLFGLLAFLPQINSSAKCNVKFEPLIAAFFITYSYFYIFDFFYNNTFRSSSNCEHKAGKNDLVAHK